MDVDRVPSGTLDSVDGGIVMIVSGVEVFCRVERLYWRNQQCELEPQRLPGLELSYRRQVSP